MRFKYIRAALRKFSNSAPSIRQYGPSPGLLNTPSGRTSYRTVISCTMPFGLSCLSCQIQIFFLYSKNSLWQPSGTGPKIVRPTALSAFTKSSYEKRLEYLCGSPLYPLVFNANARDLRLSSSLNDIVRSPPQFD